MHVILWEFRPRPGRESDFERAAGPDGRWVELFRKAEGYLGTELLKGKEGLYITIDRWATPEDFEAFRAKHAGEYESLDREYESLTEFERKIGDFQLVEGR